MIATTISSHMRKPLCIDLFCGLGGWAHGFLAEGYDVVGFDIERHVYGDDKYPAWLVLQDVLTLHGSQFRKAAVIVASPPCQAYSYRAMPWKRAKALPPPDNSLFKSCFRIAGEAGVPLVVENVRGAEKWVGPAAWHFGSYYLWGDIPALMPVRRSATKVPGFRFDGSGRSFQSASVEGIKTAGHANIRDGHGHTRHLTNQRESEGIKVSGINLSQVGFNVAAARNYRATKCHELHLGQGRRDSRKAASAQIAKIPFPLAQHIARVFKP